MKSLMANYNNIDIVNLEKNNNDFTRWSGTAW